jgi:hypothetical protein
MCWGISIKSFNIRQEQSNRILALKGNSCIIGWDGWVGINHWSSLYGVSPAVYEMEAHASSYFFFLLHKSYYCYTRLSFLPAASRNLVFFFFFLPEDHVKIDLSMVMYINRETSISLKRHVICMVLLIKGKSRGKSLIFQQERYNLNGTLSLLLLNNPLHVLCTELRHQPSER